MGLNSRWKQCGNWAITIIFGSGEFSLQLILNYFMVSLRGFFFLSFFFSAPEHTQFHSILQTESRKKPLPSGDIFTILISEAIA